MKIPLRWALGVPFGGAAIVGSFALEGGHPTVLLQPTALLVVLGTAFGGFLLLRGGHALLGLLRTLLLGAPADASERAMLRRDVALFERLSLLGGGLALFVGGTQAIAAFATPQQVGPALSVAIVCIVTPLLLKVLVALPLQQHLAAADASAVQSPLRAGLARTLHAFGTAALLAVGIAFASFGARTGTGFGPLQVTSALLALGVVLPSLLAAPSALFAGELTRTRCQAVADALWCGGALAAAAGVMHVFSVLDQPSLLAPGFAVAFAAFVLPAALAVLVSLRGSFARDDAAADEAGNGTRSPVLYPALALGTLVALAAAVVFVLQLLARPAN